MLEDAFAVTETAVRGVERHAFAVFHAEHLDPLDRILRLAAVGANVLNGRRPGLARDQREVFDPPQSALYGPLHQVVPFDPGVGAHVYRAPLFAEQGDPLRDGGQQQPVVVLCEKYVVAAAQDAPAVGDSAAENRVQILLGLEFGEPGGVLLDAETVASAQAGLVKFSDHDVQS